MTSPDPAAVMSTLQQASADIILPRFRKLTDEDVRSKGGKGNLVTVADEECERFLSRVLIDLLPGSYVVGEEAVSASPLVLHALRNESWVWLVDPIDGTANFVAGTPIFCAMVALLHNGETVMSCIYRPVDGDGLTAERGGGTMLTDLAGRSNRVRLPSAADQPLSSMVAALYNKDLAPLKGKFARISRSGCAGHDYWNAVEGHLSVLAYRRLQPWDHAPGDLIYRQAGGVSRMLSGASYEPSMPDQIGILCAPTEDVWRRIADMARLILL